MRLCLFIVNFPILEKFDVDAQEETCVHQCAFKGDKL